jgi:asparagine synthase (glutamine-hydrolysing)
MRAALDVMRSRGPDGQGVWRDGPVLLGHRRLRIVDTSPAADQPLVSTGGTVAVVFNGEVYNHGDLRESLRRAGHTFRTRTDGEVLVHGYQQWGLEGLLRRLDGMFAFGLWDGRRRRLALARDRFGKKPLFYSSLGGGLAFASSLAALRRLLPVSPPLDPGAIDDYLAFMAVPPPATAFQGVWALPPAHAATLTAGGGPRVRRFDRLCFAPTGPRRLPEVLATLDGLLTQAVAKRLGADVPLGAFLSGGIDSGLVVAKAALASSRPLTTVTVGFPGDGADERALARLTARRYGTDHHEEEVGPSSLERLPEIQASFGQPFADPSALPTFAVAAAARRHFTVALNGDGGDELFAGYARPVVAKAAERYARLAPAWIRRRLFAGRAPAWAHAGGSPLRRNLGRLLEAGRQGPGGALRSTRALAGMGATLYRPEFRQALGRHDPERLLEPFVQASGDWATRVLEADLWTYLSPQLLTKMDTATMAVGLEARSPLLDWDLAAYAAALPVSTKMPGYGTKPLLRQLARRYLPSELTGRHKRGFSPPVAAWLRGPAATLWRERWRDGGAPVWRLLDRTAVDGLWERHARGEDWGEALYTVLCLDTWLEGERDGGVLVREVVS